MTSTEVQNCPHCQSMVNPGAVVCTGCQAELRRGALGSDRSSAALVGAVLGGLVGMKSESTIVIYAIVGAIVATLLSAFLNRNKLTWIRAYRTRR